MGDPQATRADPAGPVTIHPLTTAAAIRPLEELQHRVWGFDPVEVVPLHVLLTAARHGGSLLGAVRGERVVGFAFGFHGTDLDGTPVLCSHLLAVAPEARGAGVALALKQAQRRHALAAGVRRVLWTFDPLEHGNARLNLARLAARSDRYLTDLYGTLRDELNAGLPTDRLEVVWDLEAPEVIAACSAPAVGRSGAGLAVGARTETSERFGPRLDPDGPGGGVADPDGAPAVRLAAPADAQALRTHDPDAALVWRLHLREGMTRLFGAGYVAVSAGFGTEGPEYRFVRSDRLRSG